jgi:hypothetical protein
MSAGLCEIIACPTIQQHLDNTFAAGNMRPEKLPFLSYVMSESNRSAASFEITGTSKVRTLQITYDQPMLESEVGSNGSGCAASTAECDTYQTYEFDTTANRFLEFTVSPQDLVGTCEENSAFIARKIQKRIDALKLAVSGDLADTATSDRGIWSVDTATIGGTNMSANDVLEFNTLITSGTPNIMNSALFEQIRTALEMSRIEDAGIFGGNELASYLRKSAGGADDGIGLNLMAQMERYGIAMLYDRQLTDSLTAINATNLAVGRGSIIPAGFSLYEAEANKMNNQTDIADTIYDPETGMKFDLRIQRVCDDWNINIRATYQFYTWPDDLYQVGSNFEGVKGLAAIEVVCDDLQECA